MKDNKRFEIDIHNHDKTVEDIKKEVGDVAHHSGTVRNTILENFVKNPAIEFLLLGAVRAAKVFIDQQKDGKSLTHDEIRVVALADEIIDAMNELRRSTETVLSEHAAMTFAIKHFTGKDVQFVGFDKAEDFINAAKAIKKQEDGGEQSSQE